MFPLHRIGVPLLGVGVLMLLAAGAQAAERVALVIGNAAYQVGRLHNPVNDASDMAATLRGLGFTVLYHANADKRTMAEAIWTFGRQLPADGVGLFYYSGHGVQHQGRNYLIPLGATIRSAADLEFEAVDAQRVLTHMEEAGSRLNVVILDACRNNPFTGWSKSLPRGLARLPSIRGSILAYATQPGNVAEDGTGRNSPYTTYLLRYIKQPGLTVQEMFRKVGLAVLQETGGTQEPWYASSPTPDFCFAGCEPKPAPMPSPPVSPAPTPPGSQVVALLQVCEAHLRANRLTTGASGTAWACYQEVLRQDPTNVHAVAGLGKIAETYRGWAEGALQRGDRERARGYVEKLKQVSPEHPALAALETGLRPPVSTPTPSPQPPSGTQVAVGVYPPRQEPTAPRAGNEWREPTTGMEFVYVPGGCFQMGSPASESERYDNEGPVHEVCVDGFWLGKYEVTNGEYRRFKPGHDSGEYKGYSLNGDRQPVVQVSWEDAKVYAAWLSRQSGHTFGLPTEAEWEYACRAGTQTARYWGDAPEQACRYGNVYDERAKGQFNYSLPVHNCNDGSAVTAPVGQFVANGFGLHDLLGNVVEWVEDAYSDTAYGEHRRQNPLYSRGSSERVLRGSSWLDYPRPVRCAFRGINTPGTRNFGVGFRLRRTD